MFDRIVRYIVIAVLFFILGIEWDSYIHKVDEAQQKETKLEYKT